ncbi:MAG TPA: FixH family protein, partial [Aestuariivirga sp.]|nr:FixH family protein [Aestuariivirga sp.]
MIRTFTGWHMAAITISFFAVIIAVNLTLAVFASSSWSGLVVANSYVA